MSPCPCGQHNLELQVYKSLAGGGVGERFIKLFSQTGVPA